MRLLVYAELYGTAMDKKLVMNEIAQNAKAISLLMTMSKDGLVA